jgi:glycosyltransferase involved in cell wall biosynthesis
MRILVDYRAALRSRTGVGEYILGLTRAYRAAYPADEITLFTSSWKDRPPRALGAELGARVVDRRIPVRVLNRLWHRAEWPPAEMLAGACDVAHSAHPLLMPARRAAQVITIHDLFFLAHGERTRAEIRRDYPALAASHAQRADAIVTSTAHARMLVSDRFGVPAEHIYVCPPGPPVWRQLGRAPNVPPDGYILFVGTLEPRKNLGLLLDAYANLVALRAAAPRLLIAGRPTPDAAAWLNRLAEPPFHDRARHLGYVPEDELERLFAGARVLVLPSLDEGFGLPALAAMSAGVPVIASRRGSLPEVVGDGGVLVEPDDPRGLTEVLDRIADDRQWAMALAEAGLRRAATFSWQTSAATLKRAYGDAVRRRHGREAGSS